MKKFIVYLILGVAAISIASFFYKQPNQLMFIVVDGVNVKELNKLISENKLPNFKKIFEENGLNSYASISVRDNTGTAPGNAELHTGLKSNVTKIVNNDCNRPLPEDITTFERLKKFNGDIVTGSIYGKETCYIPLSLLQNAKNSVDWWNDKGTYEQRNYKETNCTNSKDIAQQTTEFLIKNKKNDFYLFLYFGVPDCIGHSFSVPSKEYTESLVNVDDGLQILLLKIADLKISPQIIISSDHGWEPNTDTHHIYTDETSTIPLLTNNRKLIDKKIEKKQCDIAPTILKYFGLKEELFQDIINNGCAPLSLE
jgi:predicted AlkP superfamily pyrophosphatase or phosphodiesterase